VNANGEVTPAEARILILAPTGRDAPAIASVLASASHQATIVASLGELTAEARAGVGALVVAQEALQGPQLPGFMSLLAEQPPWSDIPVIVLTVGGETVQNGIRSLAAFGPSGNVTLLDRPLRQLTLVTAARVALRARRKQYEMRALVRRLDAQAHELERSNSDLDRFAAMASHDLQEPLRMISSYVSLIRRHLPTPRERRLDDFLGFAEDGARRMQAMIRAFLDYARIGSEELRFRDLPFAEVVRAAMDGLPAIHETTAEIEVRELPQVHGDAVLLTQLMQNLIGNAIKYRAEGRHPRIVIAGEETPRECLLTVTDNGVGIASEDLERAFQLFNRLGTDRASGSGIGLATAKRIVDHHRGRIWVESVVGIGSTFAFTLPRARSEPAPADERAESLR
jgi:signal transduction histidine kinase